MTKETPNEPVANKSRFCGVLIRLPTAGRESAEQGLIQCFTATALRDGRRALAGFLAVLACNAMAQGATPQSAFPGVPFVAGAPVREQPAFDYPREARQRGRAGTLLVAVLVGVDGVPVRHRIIASDPPLIFDAAINEAMPQFRFAPAMRDGTPTQYETHLSPSFDPQLPARPKN